MAPLGVSLGLQAVSVAEGLQSASGVAVRGVPGPRPGAERGAVPGQVRPAQHQVLPSGTAGAWSSFLGWGSEGWSFQKVPQAGE